MLIHDGSKCPSHANTYQYQESKHCLALVHGLIYLRLRDTLLRHLIYRESTIPYCIMPNGPLHAYSPGPFVYKLLNTCAVVESGTRQNHQTKQTPKRLFSFVHPRGARPKGGKLMFLEKRFVLIRIYRDRYHTKPFKKHMRPYKTNHETQVNPYEMPCTCS